MISVAIQASSREKRKIPAAVINSQDSEIPVDVTVGEVINSFIDRA